MDGYQLIIKKFVLGFVLITAAGTARAQVIRDSVIVHTYPRLYSAVLKRQAAKILPFTQHSDLKIRSQAWRAFAQTPVNSIASFIQKVEKDGSKPAWFALSMHKISPKQQRTLALYWKNHPARRKGISLVLGKQGDSNALSFLLNHIEEIRTHDYEEEAALAVGRLMTRFSVYKNQQYNIMQAAFLADNPRITRAWLYGFFRGDKNNLNDALKDSLYQRWQQYGVGRSATIDQYVAKILAPKATAQIIHSYHRRGMLKNYPHLGIELAQSIAKMNGVQLQQKAVKTLLKQPNVQVKQQALIALTGKLHPGGALFSYIQQRILNQKSTAASVWLDALNALGAADSTVVTSFAGRLNRIAGMRPYLYAEVLKAWLKSENGEQFLHRIHQTVEEGNTLKSMFAVNALSTYWKKQPSLQKKRLKPQVRELVFKSLSKNDRGLTYALQSLLSDSLLFNTRDFHRINRYLKKFSLPGDIEVFQAFGSLYKNRFEKQAKPMIDSLAAIGYAPLNRSLKRDGWKVEVPEVRSRKFRKPNWKRLWKLGRHPVWVLKTVKGTIKVRMNTLSAPATVSAIDSLTRAGAYNGIPFHRVVPNFVIQGGDIERRDGFGGPDFVIPTEASEQEFVRGAAGIASAGPDTEGSQYFFMLQWSPHLDGHYTLFGHIIEGMDVAEKMVEGDKVINASWK